MASLLDIFVEVRPDTDRLEPELKKKLKRIDFDGPGKQAGGRFGSSFASAGAVSMKKLGVAAAGIFAIRSVKDFFGSAFAEALEAQKVSAITAQVIKSTGGAAKISAKQVDELTTAISNKTGIDDEAVQSGANLLLTFTNIRNEVGRGNDIFNQATSIITDMGAALGKEPRAAAIQLGKALQDPVKGISALTRVGVSFTAGQKESIKAMVASGDTMGAQKMILAELRREFGGAAEAAATPAEKAAVAWANFKESVGTALMPTVERLLNFFTSSMIPAMRSLIAWAGKLGDSFKEGGLSGAIDFLQDEIGRALPIIRRKLAEWGEALVDWIQPRIKPALDQLGKFAASAYDWVIDVGLPGLIRKLAQWGVALEAWIRPRIPGMTKALAEVVADITVWLLVHGLPKIQLTLAKMGVELVAWIPAQSPKMIVEFGKFNAKLLAYVGTEMIPDLAAKMFTMGVTGVVKIASGMAAQFPAFAEFLASIPGRIVRAIGDLNTLLVTEGAQVIGGLRTGVRSQFESLGEFLHTIPTRIRNGVGNLSGTLQEAGKQLIRGLIHGIGEMFEPLRNIAGKIVGVFGGIGGALGGAGTERGREVGRQAGSRSGPLPRGSYRVGVPIWGYPGHTGQDLPAPTGTPVYAATSGVISRALSMATSYGKHIFLEGPGGLQTRYAHMSALLAREGQRVSAGQMIGKVGSTGNSTGPHLHFETRQNGDVMDPRKFFKFDIGGLLPPGLSMMANLTGKPEPVLSGKQWSDIHSLASRQTSSGPSVTYNGPIYVVDIDEMMNRQNRAMRNALTMAGLPAGV